VCTDIIHLHDLKLQYYRGSFQDFEKMYEQRRVEANKAFERYEKQMRAAKQSGEKSNQKKVQDQLKQVRTRRSTREGSHL